MVAPIFKFKNIKVTLTNNSTQSIYGVQTYSSTAGYAQLDQGTFPTEVSAILLTVQCSNTTGKTNNTTAAPINVSAFVSNNNVAQTLVYNYPVVPNNAFDPLNGNLVLSSGDVLQIQSSSPTGDVDVVVSLLEIANATTA